MRKIFFSLGVVLLSLANIAASCNLNDPLGGPAPKATATPTPTATLAPTAVSTGTVAGPSLPRTGTLFQTSVKSTKSFNTDSAWLISEPGVLLDNTTAWTVAQVAAPYHVNVPEGGFTYFSLGQAKVNVDGVTIDLHGEQGLNYLVLVRGKIDDGIVDSDLNMTAEVRNFVPGHAIWSHTPTGAYVSRDWFRQQLVASTTDGYTNCGATGCSRVRVVLYDVGSRTYQMFEVRAGTLDNWTIVEHN